jgi:hypothetical protein
VLSQHPSVLGYVHLDVGMRYPFDVSVTERGELRALVDHVTKIWNLNDCQR